MTERLLAVPVPPQERRVPADACALLAAADAEADAVADRLHDGALQALVVARYAADAAVRGGDPALARDAVQEALVALRRAVWELRPRGEDDLAGALGELSARRPGGLDLDVDAAAAAALAPPARAAAYRFVQACLPADGRGPVRVAREAGAVAVTGGGRPDDEPGWAARAAALGGHLDTSTPCPRLLLPLHTAANADDPEGDR